MRRRTAGRNNGAAVPRTCERLDTTLNLAGIVHVKRRELDTERTEANCPIPAADVGSRSTSDRVIWGAACFSNSAHFPLMLYSKFEKPVILPPGWAMFCTKPAPTGSGTFTKTIGMVCVAC